MLCIKKILRKLLPEGQEHTSDKAVLQEAALALRTINHPIRLSILKLLNQHGAMTLTEVYEQLQIDPSVAAQQLAILRQQNIVIRKTSHGSVVYTVNYKRIDEIKQISGQL